MNVLVVNSGSSSLKYQLIDVRTHEVLSKGNCERIGLDNSLYTHEDVNRPKQTVVCEFASHADALKHVVLNLRSAGSDLVIHAIGHRIVQGAHYFTDSALVTDHVVDKIRELAALAPLHNYAAADVIDACREFFPATPNVVVFDTSFHVTLPPAAQDYALPLAFSESFQIKRYGAHGTSHRYVAQMVEQYYGKHHLRVVSAHIGNGASLCAINHGRSQDTTMGFTPLEGLVMGTRCGSIDPAIIPFVLEHSEYTPQDIDRIMNKESGLLGLSGVSSDLREVTERANAGDKHCMHALDVYVHNIKRHLGSMVFSLGGIDVIGFTAGAAENSPYLRARICEGLEDLGFVIDIKKNMQSNSGIREISAPESRIKMLVIPANEELMIALDTDRLLQQ